MYRDANAPTASLRLKRCAVYTRKSTDEGLDQAFNSLDAQREACEAYIASQRHEGWSCLPERYDDGGFSGGTMERPALRRLLADVAAGHVDVVVLYKIDRLTRALSDFARIVEVLDKAGASFVSVTQAFNTTTSMGRLTLNVLLSFAQFEREVGAERVRDKIAASKKRGLWMGGIPPLGYDVRDRALVVNDAEAVVVGDIFEHYLRLGSVVALQTKLHRDGILSKRRVNRHGIATGGKPYTRGALYVMLRNVLYVGQVSHKGTPYPGQHDAIIDQGMFDRAQTLLDENRNCHELGLRADDPSLLSGRLWDNQGRRMSPSHTTKGARRYRYYASRGDNPTQRAMACLRIPAADLEAVVIARVVAFLRDAAAVHDAIDALALNGETTETLLLAAATAARELAGAEPHRQRRTLLPLIECVIAHDDHVQIFMAVPALFKVAGYEQPADLPAIAPTLLEAPANLQRRAREIRLTISADQQADAVSRDPGLIKLVVNAHAARQAFETAGERSIGQVAAGEGYHPDYFSVLVKLGYLSPDITAAILAGRQPPALSRQRLARIRALPICWDEQKRLLGFDNQVDGYSENVRSYW